MSFSFLSQFFHSPIFLTALVAAAGPTIIHLLNRRRRQTIYWGPMDFLREIIKRNRRILQLRDIILLVLRTLAVILFVLAIARAFWPAGGGAADADEPVHAVVVIDNSLSMAYTEMNESLLYQAKAKAVAYIESIPDGSEVSVIPLCGFTRSQVRDVHSTTEGAVEAVGRIEVADRSAPITVGLAQAQKACKLASTIPTKRVVLIGDVQRRTWSFDGAETYLEGLDAVQLVRVGPTQKPNTWVADFKLLHAIADTETTAVFRTTLRHEGPPRQGDEAVHVTLAVAGKVVDERDEDMIAGQEKELDFHYKFNVSGSSAEPLYIPAEIRLSPDRLDGDNFRSMIVPVVARAPVVFIDQYGANERPQENLIGETERVREWMASRSRRRLVDPVLRTINDVTRDDLKDARLVVMGGVTAPTPEAVTMLREYVEQGGSIFLAAGAKFDPIQWTSTAWLDGAGILPAPLKDVPLGQVPQANQREVEIFSLDKPSLAGEALYLDATPQELDHVLEMVMVFKAVVADVPAGRKAIARGERERIIKQRDRLVEYGDREKLWAEKELAGTLTDEEAAQRNQERLDVAALSHNWLAWGNPLARDDADFSVDDLVNATQPLVLGRYNTGEPFAVQRQIGKGRVVMVTSGMSSAWNTIARKRGVLLFDRIVRSLLRRSLPDRTFGPESQIVIPVAPADQTADFTVQRPGDADGRLQRVEALGPQSYGLLLGSVEKRGVYQVHRRRRGSKADAPAPGDTSTMLLAVNGPAAESELAPRSDADLPEKIGKTEVTWIGPDEDIALAGKTYAGHDLWQVLLALALACILLEMLLLIGWRLAGLARTSAAADQAREEAL